MQRNKCEEVHKASEMDATHTSPWNEEAQKIPLQMQQRCRERKYRVIALFAPSPAIPINAQSESTILTLSSASAASPVPVEGIAEVLVPSDQVVPLGWEGLCCPTDAESRRSAAGRGE